MLSDGAGAMTVLGRSTDWRLGFWDPAAGTQYWGSAGSSPPGADFDASMASLDCGSEKLEPMDSELIVPDALERFAPHDPHPGAPAAHFLRQELACGGEWTARAQVIVAEADPASSEPQDTAWWFVEYTAENVYDRICGPCSGPTACDTCVE